MTAPLTKPGDDVAKDHGHFQLKAIRGVDCLTVQVRCGTVRVDALTKTFPLDRVEAARIWWHEIAQAADAYLPEHLIVARLQALTAAGRAITVSEETS